MQSGQGGAAGATLPRLRDLYDPTGSYEVTSRDIEYRREGDRSWLLRLYQPQGPGPFPLLMEVHGGAWNNNDRTQNEPQNQAFASTGIVVAAIEFRQGSEGRYPGSIADINYATRWLKHHAREFNAVPESIGSIGSSSGGHLNMLTAMKPTDPRYASVPLDEAPDVDANVAYVIMTWPVIDPLSRYNFAKGLGRAEVVQNHHNFWGDEAAMIDGNPQLMLERGESATMPPALLIQGAADEGITPGMAEKFGREYSKAGGLIELALYPGAPHGFMRDPGPNTDHAREVVKSFIARQLRTLDAR